MTFHSQHYMENRKNHKFHFAKCIVKIGKFLFLLCTTKYTLILPCSCKWPSSFPWYFVIILKSFSCVHDKIWQVFFRSHVSCLKPGVTRKNFSRKIIVDKEAATKRAEGFEACYLKTQANIAGQGKCVHPILMSKWSCQGKLVHISSKRLKLLGPNTKHAFPLHYHNWWKVKLKCLDV